MKHLKSLNLILIFCINGCQYFTMEQSFNQLEFRNHEKYEIQAIINLSFPDSALYNSVFDVTISSNDWNYVRAGSNLKKETGLTIFIFDRQYSKTANGNIEKLDKSKILKKYYLSTAQLDSLNWILTYP